MRTHIPRQRRCSSLLDPSGRIVRLAAGAVAVVVCACAATSHPEGAVAPAGTGTVSTASTASPPAQTTAPQCELVCQGASLVRHEIPPGESADHYTSEAVDKANETLNAMHDDLLACYTARVKVSPKAHAFLTIDIVVGPGGRVQSVETQGGALLGETTMQCIVERITRGSFAPPPGGGTMRFQVPFSLRRVGPDETI